MASTVLLAVVMIAVTAGSVASAASPTHAPTQTPQMSELKKQVDYLEKVIGGMSRQMMLQQLFVEERIRSDGDSGLKQIRYSTCSRSLFTVSVRNRLEP